MRMGHVLGVWSALAASASNLSCTSIVNADELLGALQIEEPSTGTRIHFELTELTAGGYVFHGEGTDIATEEMEVDVTWNFTAGANLTTTFLGGGIWRMEAPSEKRWLIKQLNACAIEGDTCYEIIDPDAQAVVMSISTSDEWPITSGSSPTLAQLAYLYVQHFDPGTPMPCDPTLIGCAEAAEDTCGEGLIHSITYSCNPQTGEVTCSFTCDPSQ